MEQQDLAVLNRQAIAAAKQHMGLVAWGTVALTAATLAGYVATLWLAITGGLPLWAGVALLGALTYLSYTPLHEAAHGNIHGDRAGLKWLNELCGYVSAQMIMVPYGTHRVEHFTHHRYTNQPGKDPDHVVSGMGGGAWPFVKAVVHFVWNQWTFLPGVRYDQTRLKPRATDEFRCQRRIAQRLRDRGDRVLATDASLDLTDAAAVETALGEMCAGAKAICNILICSI